MFGFATNPFSEPKRCRQQILGNKLLTFPKKSFSGKSLACLFLTRFCSVGCPFCFYKSAPAWRKRNIEDQFSDEGIAKFIEFAEHANLGYLLVSGGGEPLNQRKHILQLVEKVATDRIVLVTSGNWAKNLAAAKNYVMAIYEAMQKRDKPATVVLRISISTGHTAKIGLEPARNLIKIFRENFSNSKDFLLQVKTFAKDPTLNKVLANVEGFSLEHKVVKLVSDNTVLVKKIPEKQVLSFPEGLQINVGISKMFFSSLQADLNNPKFIAASMGVFEEDTVCSEDNNPAVVFNPYGEDGIDWSINYNGDICTWQNQVRDNYLNLYEDSYAEIIKANFNDPIIYSFLDKGRLYREKVVSEVNPRAVLRMKAIALRDTSGTLIFEEEHTRLYFAIRVLQDYMAEGRITENMLATWPDEIRKLVELNRDDLQTLYKQAEFSIIKQQMAKPFNEQEWLDLFYLIKLKHYELDAKEIQLGLNYYNERAKTQFADIDSVKPDSGDIERRLTERVMHIKPMQQIVMPEVKQATVTLATDADNLMLVG